MIDWLNSEKKAFQIMAPTGRAAKVLRDKTTFGTTVHKGIYDFDKLIAKETDNEDDSKKSYHYYFPLRNNDQNRILIIDEASMISNMETSHELFTFGSGQLLKDILSYANLNKNTSKLIFIGDDAQLPPVTDNSSCALNEDFFKENGNTVATATLNTIHRQLDSSGILQVANTIRDILKKPSTERTSFIIEANEQVHEIDPDLIATDYVSEFPMPEVGSGVVICYSNAQTYEYNKSIREKLFPDANDIIDGDVILINNNNYSFYGIELFNGDMAKVVYASPNTESRTVPVTINKTKKNVTLVFRDIKIRLPHFEDEISCKLVDSLLNSTERDLSIEEMRALYVDFCIRFNEKQKRNKENDLPSFREGSQEFKDALRIDPYFNALKVKYGYSITCHKAQGGEWDKVYVDYSGRIGLFNDALRWCYTATTRAKKTLVGANLPKIDSFQKLSFTSIAKVANVADDYYQPSAMYITPYHDDKSPIAKRLKYHEIVEKLADTPYSVVKVDSFEYSDKYTFECDSKQFQLDLYHKKSGVFGEITPQMSNDDLKAIKEILDKPYSLYIPLSYHPTTELFQSLYQKMSAACSELDIQITNVIEYPERYYVIYYFKTSGRFSYIQFYYNKKNGFTTANPKSDIGDSDTKLQELITLLI